MASTCTIAGSWGDQQTLAPAAFHYQLAVEPLVDISLRSCLADYDTGRPLKFQVLNVNSAPQRVSR